MEVYVDRPPASPAETALVAPPWSDGALARAGPDGGGGRARPRGLLARGAPRRAASRGSTSRVTARSGRASRARRRAGRPAYVPTALAGVSRQPRRRRAGRRSAAFHDASGHFLVTNGPYRLASWTEDTSVLQVFRDFTYPMGLGAFDRFALPLRAFVTGVEAARRRARAEGRGRAARALPPRVPDRPRAVRQARPEQDAGACRSATTSWWGRTARSPPRAPRRRATPGTTVVDLRAVGQAGRLRGPRRARRRRQPHQPAREGGPVDTLAHPPPQLPPLRVRALPDRGRAQPRSTASCASSTWPTATSTPSAPT